MVRFCGRNSKQSKNNKQEKEIVIMKHILNFVLYVEMIAFIILSIMFICPKYPPLRTRHYISYHEQDDFRMKNNFHLADNQQVNSQKLGSVTILSLWPDFYTSSIFDGDEIFILKKKNDNSNAVFRGILLHTTLGWDVKLREKTITIEI